jgi:hypothetical protein
MTNHITTPCLPQLETKSTADLFDNWFDPVETGLRDRAREFLQAMLEAELEEVLGRSRLIKQATRRKGMRNSSPSRRLHLAKILGCYGCNRVKILRSNRGSVKMSAVGTSAKVARCGCQAANRLSGLFDIRADSLKFRRLLPGSASIKSVIG